MNFERIEAARERIAPYIHRTPLLRSTTLSALTGREVFLKAELLQKTGSYKPRGMLNRLMTLTAEERARGVITFSAGNGAQGLAYAAGIVGAKATVAMPAAASPVKAEATRQYGAEVILHGTARECFDFCLATTRERDLLYISSYNDLDLMAGHASLGLEVLDDLPDLAALYVGVGGGGMMGGVALALQARNSRAALFGVEPTGAAKMARSLSEGRAVMLDRVDTVADGLACPETGALCFEIVRERADGIVLVDDTAIVEAMKLLMLRAKLYAEPAGAAALAGLLASADRTPPGSRIACVISGGNLDLARLGALLA